MFTLLADRLGAGPRVAGRFFLLTAATVALLNLDAAVVLLTPLAVRVARRTGRPDLPFAAVPAVLALLASSALPVSNLTNLVVVEHGGVGTFDLLAHLGLPTLAAVLVAWLRLRPQLAATPTHPQPAGGGRGAEQPRPSGSQGVVAGWTLALAVVSFVVFPALGFDLWPVALAADLALLAVVRRVPWRSFPLAMVVGVPIVALAVGELVDGVGTTDSVLVAGLGGAVAANLVNNLPAFLGGIDLVTGDARWALLLGVNAGAGLLLTGSLSTLLWRRLVREQGISVTWRTWGSIAARATMPAFLAALLVLAVQESLR